MIATLDTSPTKPHFWDEATHHLLRRDRILKKIIPQHPEVWLTTQSPPFVTLARAIVGQQVSVTSAEKVWATFTAAVGKCPTPSGVAKFTIPALRECGLSVRKAEYIFDLAQHFVDHKVHPESWDGMSDEQVIAELVAIRGISRWTAEMFLIFNLQRPDVLPLDDPGLLKAISLHYFSGEPVSRFEAREVSLAWQPWRTVATWYLWRSLDSISVQY